MTRLSNPKSFSLSSPVSRTARTPPRARLPPLRASRTTRFGPPRPLRCAPTPAASHVCLGTDTPPPTFPSSGNTPAHRLEPREVVIAAPHHQLHLVALASRRRVAWRAGSQFDPWRRWRPRRAKTASTHLVREGLRGRPRCGRRTRAWDPPAGVRRRRLRARHNRRFSATTRRRWRLAASATGAQRKNVAAGTARRAEALTVATSPTSENPRRWTAVSAPPQKCAYCSPVAPTGMRLCTSRWVRRVTSAGFPYGVPGARAGRIGRRIGRRRRGRRRPGGGSSRRGASGGTREKDADSGREDARDARGRRRRRGGIGGSAPASDGRPEARAAPKRRRRRATWSRRPSV